MGYEYDYLKNMKDDILDCDIMNDVKERLKTEDRDGIEHELYEYFWVNDSVTGNGSGSYTFSSNKAREYVLDNEDIVEDVINEFDLPSDVIAKHMFDWEYWDVSIRCYLLAEALSDVLDEIEEEEE